MIWSRWRPERGGYEYFESNDKYGLGDDMPVPALPSGTEIGVASTEAGRPMPNGSRYVGFGALPKGAVTKLTRNGLSGALGSPGPGAGDLLFFLLGVGLGWYLWKRKG